VRQRSQTTMSRVSLYVFIRPTAHFDEPLVAIMSHSSANLDECCPFKTATNVRDSDAL